MFDPDSAGLSAELPDITTWDFANFSCHLYFGVFQMDFTICRYSTMIGFLKDLRPRWVRLWGIEQVLKLHRHQ